MTKIDREGLEAATKRLKYILRAAAKGVDETLYEDIAGQVVEAYLGRTSPVGGWEPAEGFVLVPREPTDSMIDAGVASDYGGTLGSRVSNCWAAMLAASPAQPGGEG